MHPDNRFYGHDRVLAEYCGVDPRPIVGHLQHGWGPTTGYSHFQLRLLRSLPRLVWSEHNAVCSRSALGGVVRRVGAPYGYLLSTMGPPAPPSEPSTLYFPAHGWEGHSIRADYDRLIGAIGEREENPVTICLYWHEFEQPLIRRQFLEAGFRVVSHGRRSDPGFLLRFRDELRLHHRVAANNVGTPIWYGGLAGREVEVYGPRFDFGNESEARDERERERRRWPELVAGGLDGARSAELAASELGCSQLLEPDELQIALGWDGAERRGRRPVATLEHHSRRVIVNLGIRAHLPGFR